MTFRELQELTSAGGRQSFHINGNTAEHACIDCGATFPQTDKGWADLRAHGLIHGRPSNFQWSDIHGKTLRIHVISAPRRPAYGDNGPAAETDVYAIDDASGIAYHIATVENEFTSSYSRTGTKWEYSKVQKLLGSVSNMQTEAESPSNGCASTDAK